MGFYNIRNFNGMAMILSTETIHILRLIDQTGTLYYYQGNFYHPLELKGSSPGLIKRGIRDFIKANKSLFESDRASPDYKNVVELFDEQCGT